MSERRRIPLAQPHVGVGEKQAVARVLDSGQFVLGQEVAAFERALAKRTKRAHGIAVSSGTVALELALWSLDIGEGDEVLVTGFGFVAAANAVARIGGIPVPVDVDRHTWNISLEDAAQAISGRTRAVISIDQFGLCAEASPLEAFAKQHGIFIIVDAACSLGGQDSAGLGAGSYGTLATMSFHPRKVITTGEGGAIICNSPLVAQRLRRLRNHGRSDTGEYIERGTNARMSEIAAAIGGVQLECVDSLLAMRRNLVASYQERLGSLVQKGLISWQIPPSGAIHSWQTFAILLEGGFDRNIVCRALVEQGIEAGPATFAFPRLACYANHPRTRAVPVVSLLHDRAIALPLFPQMASSDLQFVCDVLERVLQ